MQSVEYKVIVATVYILVLARAYTVEKLVLGIGVSIGWLFLQMQEAEIQFLMEQNECIRCCNKKAIWRSAHASLTWTAALLGHRNVTTCVLSRACVYVHAIIQWRRKIIQKVKILLINYSWTQNFQRFQHVDLRKSKTTGFCGVLAMRGQNWNKTLANQNSRL